MYGGYMKDKVFKYDGKVFLNKQALYSYISENKKNEMQALGWDDPSRFWFFVKYKKTQGTSVISGNPTEWNPVTERYERFANEEERKIYREDFKNRMIKKYGKEHLTDDPEQQKKMLSQRSISSVYTWTDGSTTKITGEFERHFLHFLESVYSFKSSYLTEPPTIFYKINNKVHFYLPDFYIPSLNLIVEIKGGNEHYQKRDQDKESYKKNAAESEGFDFVQVNDKVYTEFNVYFKDKVLDK